MPDRLILCCAACGCDQLAVTENPQPDDIVTCKGCGATGRYADVQAAGMKRAKELVEKLARNIFRK